MKLRYVVIDDAAFIRELIKNTLNASHLNFVGEASDGAEALSVISQTLPDLVFLDMVMPRMNGLETALELKNAYPDMKIIGCSTMDSSSIVSRALQQGFDAYITKPFTKQQILFEVENLFPTMKEAAND